MLTNLINALRELLGSTSGFYHQIGGGTYSNYQWDYGLIIEYVSAVIILCICIVSVFKLLRCLFK